MTKLSDASRATTVWDIRRTALANYASLVARPNVAYLTVGYKVRAGLPTREKSLRFHVHKKEARLGEEAVPSNLQIFARNARHIGDISTDVEEVGYASAFGLRSGHILRAFDNDSGVCGITYIKNGKRFLLTNAHVVVDVRAGGTSGPVSILNRVDQRYYQVGTVKKSSRLVPGVVTTSDLAVVEVHQSYVIDQFMILDSANDIDRIDGIDTLSNYQYWYVVNGRKFSCARPERIVGVASILVDGTALSYAEFWQFTMTEGAATRGHSGALLCRSSGEEVIACGLIFGGIEPNRVFAFPFNKVWRVANGL